MKLLTEINLTLYDSSLLRMFQIIVSVIARKITPYIKHIKPKCQRTNPQFARVIQYEPPKFPILDTFFFSWLSVMSQRGASPLL